MKTALLYKILIVLLVFPTVSFCVNEHNGKGKYTKEKTIKKEFAVNANATLDVNNSYGNIDIVTWNENRINIEVIIITNGNNEEKVQQKLDEITVDFESSLSYVSAKTIFNKNKSSSWWKWANDNHVNMKVNYVIKMPITNHVKLNNDYGNINLDKLEGRADINCDYGQITTKELMAENNSLNFDYTNNCYFEYINGGSINADYSEFTVGKTKRLDINADYTKSKIEIAENITYNNDYGAIAIDKVNNVTGNGDYLSTKIGDVYKSIALNADYGSIKIANMTANAGNVTIESDYTGIKIGMSPGYNFNFEIDLEYCSLNSPDGFQFNKKRVESSDKYYQGYYGSENSGNQIKISSDYGSVTFEKN